MSTLRYLDGRYNSAAGTRAAFGALSDDLVAEGHPPMVVNIGDREKQDQLDIWYQRMTLTPGGRKVYGSAWWQGRLWYRIHPDAVAVPDTSNHEKRRSNDLLYPYNSDTAAHRRAQVLARRHNITCEGMGFREWWHWTFWGALGAIGGSTAGGGSVSKPGAVAPLVPEEDEMKFMYVDDDGNKRPVWVLLNVKTGKIVTTYSQAQATSWTVPWGNAQRATRQQFLDAIDAIQKTS